MSTSHKPPVRILHVFYRLDKSLGGPLSYVASLQLAAQNCIRSPKLHMDAAAPHGTDTLQGFELIFKAGSPLRFLLQLLKKRRNYHCIHIHGLFGWHCLLGGLVCIFFGIPFVISPHGNLQSSAMMHRAVAKRMYMHLVLRPLFRRARKVTVTGDFEADVVRQNFPRVRLLVLPPCLPRPDADLQAGQQPVLRMLFVGRLHPHKGLERVFRAIQSLNKEDTEFALEIIGSGTPHYTQELQSLASSLGISSQVKFHGHLNARDRKSVSQSCQFLVLMSASENFSYACAEALCLGLPVVLSRQVGLASTVEKFNAGIAIEYDDHEGLVSALKTLADSATQALMSANAQSCADICFRAENTAEQLRVAYQI